MTSIEKQKRIFRKNIGVFLRDSRLEKNLTQLELASKSGLCPGAISAIERGGSIPSFFTMLKIASTLDLSLDYVAECLT